jgi:hypothetical protein
MLAMKEMVMMEETMAAVIAVVEMQQINLMLRPRIIRDSGSDSMAQHELQQPQSVYIKICYGSIISNMLILTHY